ncbi:hypothetical protein EMIT0P253_340017 [Pseudomonas sp. IT-P253]
MQRLVMISRPLTGSPNGSASGCKTTARAPSASAWPMRLPVRPQVVSSSLMMFLRTSQRTTARARGSCTGNVEIFGTMMLWEFMVQACCVKWIFCGAPDDAFAGKPRSYGFGVVRYILRRHKSCRSEACPRRRPNGRQLNP